MTEIIIKNASGEELEEILRRAENTHVSGSQFEKAKIELDIRRKRRIYELQEKTLLLQEKTQLILQSKLDKIIHVLSYINQKPIRSILIAGAGAILVGIAISLGSAFLIEKFGLR